MTHSLKTTMRKTCFAITCAITTLISTTPASALDLSFAGGAVFFNSPFIGPNSTGCLQVDSLSITGAVQVRSVFNSNSAGGVIYANATSTAVRNPISVADLESCGYSDVVITAQDGANFATRAEDDEMSISWQARESAGGELFEFGFGISGVTNTQIFQTRSAASVTDTTPPTASVSVFAPNAAGEITAIITLSEVSTDFTVDDLTLVNATATLTGSGDSYTATLTPIAGGLVSVTVPVNSFSDEAGNANTAASNTGSVTFVAPDTTPPTVSIAAFTGAANGPQTAVITLSEDSINFVVGDLTLTNATATLTGSGSSYTAILTPIADGAVALSVAAGAFTDAATNANTVASNEVTATVDITAPTASIGALSGPTSGDFTATITLSEVSADFVVGDLSLVNATAALSGSGTDYTVTLTPIAGGPISVTVPVGVFSDAANNANTVASNTTSATFAAPDTTPPTASVSVFAPNAAREITAIITLSEVSTDFTVDDLTLVNAMATLTGSGDSYTATLTPIAGGLVSVTVPVGSFSDEAGNANTSASNTGSVTFVAPDTTPPTATIGALSALGDGRFTANVTLSEDTNDLLAGDFTLVNADVQLVGGTGSNFVVNLTPIADGLISVTLPANTFSDAAGNFNEVASNTSSITFSSDTTPPTVSLGDPFDQNDGTFAIPVITNEPFIGFDTNDFAVVNATVESFGGGESGLFIIVRPTEPGVVSVQVPANSFTDEAGNQNEASNTVVINPDNTPPTVVLSSTVTTISGTAPFDVNVTFDEDVTGFVAGDITVINGAVTGLTGTGAAYVATIAGTGGASTVDISVAASVATDLAGNNNTASNTLSIGGVTVEETQRIIAQFQQTRANLLVSNQPNLTGFLSGEGSEAAFSADVTKGSGTFNFATKQDKDTTAWFRINGSIANEGTSDATYVFGAFGSHFTVSPNLLIGGLLEFDYLDQDDGLSNIEGEGWLAGPYFVAKLPEQPVFFDGRLLYGQTSNDISPNGAFTDSFDTDRILAQLKVSGALNYGPTTLRPSLQLSYTNDDQEAYTDSLGSFIPSQEIRLSQAELGLDFSHYLPLENEDATLELTGGLAGIFSSINGSGNDALIEANTEGGRARLNLGVNYNMANGGRLVADTFYDGIGANDFESFGLTLGFDLKF